MFVNLSSASDDQFREFIEKVVCKDSIIRLSRPKKPSGEAKGIAFVEFTTKEDAEVSLIFRIVKSLRKNY